MTAQTAEPTPPPEWAIERARVAYLQAGSPIEGFAAALVAVRREAIEECAVASERIWKGIGKEADKAHDEENYDLYEALEERILVASQATSDIRALADKEPT